MQSPQACNKVGHRWLLSTSKRASEQTESKKVRTRKHGRRLPCELCSYYPDTKPGGNTCCSFDPLLTPNQQQQQQQRHANSIFLKIKSSSELRGDPVSRCAFIGPSTLCQAWVLLPTAFLLFKRIFFHLKLYFRFFKISEREIEFIFSNVSIDTKMRQVLQLEYEKCRFEKCTLPRMQNLHGCKALFLKYIGLVVPRASCRKEYVCLTSKAIRVLFSIGFRSVRNVTKVLSKFTARTGKKNP